MTEPGLLKFKMVGIINALIAQSHLPEVGREAIA